MLVVGSSPFTLSSSWAFFSAFGSGADTLEADAETTLGAIPPKTWPDPVNAFRTPWKEKKVLYRTKTLNLSTKKHLLRNVIHFLVIFHVYVNLPSFGHRHEFIGNSSGHHRGEESSVFGIVVGSQFALVDGEPVPPHLQHKLPRRLWGFRTGHLFTWCLWTKKIGKNYKLHSAFGRSNFLPPGVKFTLGRVKLKESHFSLGWFSSTENDILKEVIILSFGEFFIYSLVSCNFPKKPRNLKYKK